MKKCNVCKKAITRKSPGLECSKCETTVHASTQCSGLTNKQLTAVRAAETLEWVCTPCHQQSSRRSFILPDDEEEDEDELEPMNKSHGPAIDIKKLLQDINKEVNRIVMRELQSILQSVEYCSNKVDELCNVAELVESHVFVRQLLPSG